MVTQDWLEAVEKASDACTFASALLISALARCDSDGDIDTLI
jgi:hypothetical protein